MADSFIVYACPTGELGEQLERYFQQSLAICGANAAHRYMPHCTLTGFFQDEEAAIPLYLKALDRALYETQPCPVPVVTIEQLTFRSDWHGLELQSDWIKGMIATFSRFAVSPTRPEALRLKEWLHLSLAYEFPLEQSNVLSQLAQESINVQAPTRWELRFYQRHSDHRWTCHQTWQLEPTANPSSTLIHHAPPTQNHPEHP